MKTSIAGLRKEYALNGLRKQDVLPQPIPQFSKWFDEALDAEVLEPNGMVLSTVDEAGFPAGRVVLLKEVDAKGFVFYTNYESQKGQELALHPVASLTFWWVELERQVRIVGTVEKVSEAESDAYFAVRPLGSQIGAWVSAQSQVVESRATLDQKLHFYEEKFANKPVQRPPHWGGYRVIPQQVEFWQGRPSRLHDRIRYRLQDNAWLIERLSP